MKSSAVTGLVVALLIAAVLWAQESPQIAAPSKEHKWLEQFIGEWESEAEATLAPGQPPIKGKGTEIARAIGGLWIVSDLKLEIADMPMSAVQTLGYDPQKKKYVGTWIDSMTSYLWVYEGTVDESGKTLTLEAEGPDSRTPGKLSKFRDVHEFKTKDHRVLSSAIQGEDGEWVTFMTGNSRRTR